MTEMLKDKPGENIYNIYHSIWSAILKYIKNTINQQKTQCLGRKKKKRCDWTINVRKIDTVNKNLKKNQLYLQLLKYNYYRIKVPFPSIYTDNLNNDISEDEMIQLSKEYKFLQSFQRAI